MTGILTNSTFSRLVNIDTSDFSVQPGLAVSWDANEDSTVWRFNLRQGVVFHNGEPFTAHDVKFTFEYASYTGNEGITFPILGGAFIDDIVVEDDYTVVFYLSRSTADWLFYADQKIMSHVTVEREGIEAGGSVGTGPFSFTELVPGVSWTITRFDDYWGEPPVTEEIVFLVISDAGARSLTLQAGDVDAIFQPATVDIPRFLGNDNFNVFRGDNLSNIFLGINASRDAGSDLRIRQAIAHAVNRDDIVHAVYEGGAVGAPSFNFINNVSPGHTDVQHLGQNIERAIELLAEAGYDANNRLQLNLYTFGLFMPVAEILQFSLSQANIDVHITEWAQSGFSANIREDGGYDLYVQQTSSVGGVMNIIQRFITTDGPSNIMYFSSDILDALYQNAIDAPTFDEMLNYFAQIQEYMAYNVPAVPLVQQFLWTIGSADFFGVSLGNQNYTVDFTRSYVIE
jgi:peptide/nickel transport system substrate-binding protein